ncbi:hypothetical protein EB796_022562 [Bugula neritina]|uniref:Long-chain-fatty-acid--CoA ligase n=1 Tax=Bugula neritina TaxID=10212 RepID=A0A7J7IZC5_BUGNE|nr:hypothetical protein EB796_022562 [Bugula neritina]
MPEWTPKSASAVAATSLLSAAALYYSRTDPEGFTFDPLRLENQSHAHPTIPACRMSKIPDLYSASKKCFGFRSSLNTGFDTWFTYKQVLERVAHVGCGLRKLGLKPSNETLVGMFSKNRIEMMLTQLACYQHSMVIVPMYDTLGEDALIHIVNQTKMKVIICDNEDKIKNLLKWGHDQLPSVKTLVHMNSVSTDTVAAVESQSWTILSFETLENEGKNNPVELVPCKGSDLCVICYTSGTTGKPKGAMIEQNGLYRSARAGIANLVHVFGEEFSKDAVFLSYLPLAHIYEQILMAQMLMTGASVGFYSGDVMQLINDIILLQPTHFASVPRLLNRIYDMIINGVNQSRVKRWLFDKALEEKEKYYKRGIVTKATLWDRLVFRKIQAMLGGKVKVIVTGSAPIAPPILRFYRLAFGALVFEGYGQTENSSGASVTLVGETIGGEVGPPISCCMIKLVDVPEMNYFAAENVGEVCCKGVNVFKGYFKDEEKTREAIDDDGWLHSGDIGRWTERGTLKIVDRKKNIFKLSQGEYVAPEKIENVYTSCSLVAQCFVHGDSLQSTLVGIVVPDPATLPAFAQSELGLSTTSMEELCKHEEVKVAVMKAMAHSAKLFELKGFEQVKDIHLTADSFSVENNLLTPTFKLKRVQCQEKYRPIIDEMYRKLSQSQNRPRSAL